MSLIEDVFKVIKGTLSLDKIHRFTLSKITSFGVVLIGIATISLGFRDKGNLQSGVHP